MQMCGPGGGVLESAKAAELSDLLDLEVKEEQVVVSHSPVKVLVPEFADKRVIYLKFVGCTLVSVAV
jgi:ribonucleotide monophosphatase NagD (HAD superfamily)